MTNTYQAMKDAFLKLNPLYSTREKEIERLHGKLTELHNEYTELMDELRDRNTKMIRN